MKAIILAGGLGTRLRPVTYEIPKPLIPIQGKPLLRHVLDLLGEAGVTEAVVAAGYKADQIQAYCDTITDIRTTMIVEDEPLGTGGWMHLYPRPDEPVLVLNGDNLFDIDFRDLRRFHDEHGATISIALTEVDDPRAFGIADLQGDRIERFVEKPDPKDAPSRFASSGYYLFSPEAWELLPRQEKLMLENDIFPRAAIEGGLFGYRSDAQWFDTGTFERWDEVIHHWRKR